MTTTARRRGKTPLPILEGILPLDTSRISVDVIAGATLAALAIPEVMGYTKIAGTPVITGLYTIILPIVVFAILGSSRHLVVGADSASAAILATGLVAMGAVAESTTYVELAVADGAAVRRRARRRPAAQARVHRRLPLAQRPHRLPHRRRHPGRDGTVRRDVRRARAVGHDDPEVR